MSALAKVTARMARRSRVPLLDLTALSSNPAVAPNLPLLARQETDPKRLHVEGDVAGHFPGERLPLGDRCAAKARMNAAVIAADFQSKSVIKLTQGHRGHAFSIIAALGRDG